MTIAERALAAAARLVAAGVPPDEARRDATLLARLVLGWDAGRWIAHRQDAVPEKFDASFDALVARRAARQPVAYLTGEREFFGRPFRVTPAVLIPRPETEILVEETLAALAQHARDHTTPPVVIDVGTGSGCIAVTVALERPTARVVGTDISEAALEIARENAARLDAAVEFRHGSLLAGVATTPDLIVSNPPYVAEADRPTLLPEVSGHEPGVALFAGLDGLDVIRELIGVAADALAPGGWLLLEIGAGQAPHVARLIGETPGLQLDRIRLDLQSIARVVAATKR